ncbi:nuclear transport factor 2 family protein [Massilia orientalis]|uniref:Nuclear transport factor 2 family protein n=1 Tax=Massilia orientalis TaxID=3050128 RepID=A0ACC7MM58_9BURK|nr:nuclear transport factor 2 family protein [Massilia sp. YIM B02787]
MSKQLLDNLSAAWNRQDVEAVLEYFSVDGTYHDVMGEDPLGKTYFGHAAIREALVNTFAAFPGARLLPMGEPIVGDDGRAASEWIFEYQDAAGQAAQMHGCDFFVISDGKVKVKNAYMKAYVQSDAAV